MGNKFFIDILYANIQKAKAFYEATKEVDHHGMQGSLRENFLEDVLRPLLPKDVGVTSGKLIDHRGNQSNECDIIIYNENLLQPIFKKTKNDFVPIESVYYVIEVKSTLTAQGIKDTYDGIKSVKSLEFIPGYNHGGVHYSLFAYSSDLNDDSSETKRIVKLNQIMDSFPLGSFCVLDKVYSYCMNDVEEAKRQMEQESLALKATESLSPKQKEQNKQILSFNHRTICVEGVYFCEMITGKQNIEARSYLGGIINTILRIKDKTNPHLGSYIIY